MSITMRPLNGQWPRGHARIEPRRRKRAVFSATWSDTKELLEREVRLVRGSVPVLMVDVSEGQIRIDGALRATATPGDSGVVLGFEHPKVGPLLYPCDTFTDWKDNVRAIALALEALRKVDRYGVGSAGEQYTGWKAIGGPVRGSAAWTPMSARHHLANVVGAWDGGTGALSWSTIGKRALRYTHPDHGGDQHDFDVVQSALSWLRANDPSFDG